MSDFEDSLNKLLSDPEQMEKIAELAKGFIGGSSDGGAATPEGGAEPASSPFGNIDPKMLGILGKLMGEYNSGSDKQALLNAISPYLKGSRRSKVEQAVQMAKLAKLARAAMSEFGGGL